MKKYWRRLNNMYTLLLDSSNTSLAVGLAKDNVLLETIIYEAWQEQSEHMIPEIDKLLTKYQVKNEEILDVMVGIGPGSYTGVRIALTIAKTIAVALNVPVYLVSSLKILKFGNKPSICVINARSNRSYIGVFEGEKTLVSDQIMTNDEVKQYIAEHLDYVVCGASSYLGIEGYISNVLEEMLSLKNSIVPMKDSLGLKPVYLKD